MIGVQVCTLLDGRFGIVQPLRHLLYPLKPALVP
jgi:hypothetical protein